jgi:DNA-binding CsgD family transcriptional regulator
MKLSTNHTNIQFYEERNKTIVIMLSHGKSVAEVADKVCLSSWRVKGIVKQMCVDNKCKNTRHLIAKLIREGAIE